MKRIGTLRALVTLTVALVLLLGGIVESSHAKAASILFTASGTNGATGASLKASAEFDVVAGNLQVALSNIGGDVLAPSDILTGMFFTGAGIAPGGLTPLSAIIAAGSSVVFPGAADVLPVAGNVGGEWEYKGGVPTPAIHTGNQGIGSSGLDHFGSTPNFGGPNLDGPTAVDGLQYGLTSLVDDLNTGNKKVKGKEPFVRHSVVFLFTGLAGGFNPMTDISNVSFQYGTAFGEPALTSLTPTPQSVVPEPTSVALFGIGMVCCAAYRIRRRKKMPAA